MNFSYGIIAIVGVLVAISLGFIAISPDDIPEPRITTIDEKPTVCTMQWEPMCGVDGETYGNLCMLDAADIKLDREGECVIIQSELVEPSVNSHIMHKAAIVGDVLLIEVEFRDDDDVIVDHVNYDILATQGADTILSDVSSHRHPGKHPIHETIILDESSIEIQVTVQGLGHGDDISAPKGIVTTITVIPESTPEPVVEPTSMVAIVSIPPGVAVPGCEDTNECYSPYRITITSGTTVTWSNDDSAAHTVTSGNINAGLTGMFDSGLFMADSTFEFIFEDVGTYDYFCMVHPWMTGFVDVS